MGCVYGPVPSWRLGRSLGIDLISSDKTCSFDCVYCQLGAVVNKTARRKVFVPTAQVIADIEKLPNLDVDYITFSGTGEPTLAANLGEAIKEVKKRFKRPVAVLTNSSLMNDPRVRRELGAADKVVAKLDAASQEILEKVNKPVEGIDLKSIVDGIRKFSKEYPGKLALQVMFVDLNRASAPAIAELAREIAPAEVEVNTPLRPSESAPLSEDDIERIKKYFSPLKVYSVYDAKRPQVTPMDSEETKKRRPGNA